MEDDQHIIITASELLASVLFAIFFMFQMFFYGFYRLVDPKSAEDRDMLKLIILICGILSSLCAFVLVLLLLIQIAITVKNKKLEEKLDSESEITEESNEENNTDN